MPEPTDEQTTAPQLGTAAPDEARTAAPAPSTPVTAPTGKRRGHYDQATGEFTIS